MNCKSMDMSSTQKSKFVPRVPELLAGEITWPECIELRERLHDIHRRQPPGDPEAKPIRIGIEDPYGDLAHVVETTRLTEAVKVFETLADYGLVPGHGRCRTSDGRTLVRTYRQRSGERSA
jgi:hypothetical protein